MFVGFNLCTLVFLGHTSPCIPFSSRLFFRSFLPSLFIRFLLHLIFSTLDDPFPASHPAGITSRPHGNWTGQTCRKPKSIPASTIWGQLSQPISGNNPIWWSLGLPHYKGAFKISACIDLRLWHCLLTFAHAEKWKQSILTIRILWFWKFWLKTALALQIIADYCSVFKLTLGIKGANHV